MITKNDYRNILKYYKVKIPGSNQLLEEKAKSILAEKLCRCIKKIDLENEARSIGICTKTIFNKRGFKRGKFTCKKTQSVEFSKMNKNKNKNTRKAKK